MKKLGLAAVLAATTALGGAAWGQDQTIQVAVNGSSFSYGTSGYTFAVVPITVSNAAAFRVDSINQGATGGSVGIVDFIVFLPNAVIPSGGSTSYSTHSSDPNAVGYFYDASPDSVNPTALSLGPAGPLTEGEFQLVVAPYDFGGSLGDFLVTLQLYGLVAPNFPGAGPSQADELAALLAAAGGSARLVMIDAGGVVRDLGEVSLATRNATSDFTLVADGTVTASSKGTAPGMMGNLYTWVEITGFRTTEEGGPASIDGTGLQIGADMAIGTDMVAGLSLGYSDISAADGAVSQDGSLVFLQPYFAYRSGAWGGTASLIYGRGDFAQTSAGGDGTADTELLAFTFEGGYDYALSGGYTVTPTLGLIHGRETVEGTGGTLAGAGSETYTFTQTSLGARLTYDMAEGSLFGGLHADYLTQDAGSVLTDGFLSEEGLTGRLELGGSMALSNGLGLTTSVEVSGIGGDTRNVFGGLRVAFTF